MGVKEHERQVSTLKPVLDKLGDMSPELIEEDPFAPAAVVAQLIVEPKLKAKWEKAKEEVLEVITGPRPLTDEEFDQLEAQGTNVKDFLRERDRKFREKREKLLPLLVRGLFAAPFTNEALKSMAEERRKKKDEADELEALGNIDRKRNLPGKKKAKAKEDEVPATQRPLAIMKYIKRDEED